MPGRVKLLRSTTWNPKFLINFLALIRNLRPGSLLHESPIQTNSWRF